MVVCEELFLLLRRNDGKPESAFTQNGYGLAAAVITDLVLAERVSLTEDKNPKVTVTSTHPTGHPALDIALDHLAKKNGRKLSSLVTDGKLNVESQVGWALSQRGVVEYVEKRALGLIGAKYPERDPEPERQLRERLRTLLAGGTPTLNDASVLSIVQGLNLAQKVLADEAGALTKKQLKTRIEEVAQQAGQGSEASEAVRKAVQAMDTAMMTAVFTAAIAGGAASS